MAVMLTACVNRPGQKASDIQMKNENLESKNMALEKNSEDAEKISIDLAGKSLDVENSSIAWAGKAVGRGHTGTIKIKNGNLDLEGGQLNYGELVIDMTTIKNDDGSDRLVGHLKSNDFFDVENFNEAKIKTKEINRVSETNYQVLANLEIKGISNPVEFMIEALEKEGVTNMKADLSIDRSLWDVRYGSDSFFDNLGNSAISDIIDYKVILVLN